MPCYKPITAYYAKEKNPTGKRSLVFDVRQAIDDTEVVIPCGQCIGCRLERSRQWAIRCVHEASLYENNCFITLTFDDDSIQKRSNPYSVDVKDFQKFMKRLRKKYGSKIRFFHCGEYGESCKYCTKSKYSCRCGSTDYDSWNDRKTLGRPHYHACIFNHDFEDKLLYTVRDGVRLYTSEQLSQLWPYGYSTLGDVTFDSAAYVARYIMKKVTGDSSEEHYTLVNAKSGEVNTVNPEYTTMSRRPGIGKDWFDKYRSDVYSRDYVVINGKKVRPPKFYDRMMDQVDPLMLDFIKYHREVRSCKYSEDNSRERLDVRCKVKELQTNRLVRDKDLS